jgi:hypothetical protein
LQGLGAVALKNSLYALPLSDEAREDFQWLLREIQDAGGEATIFAARLVDGLTDGQVRALFDQARDADYDTLIADIRALEPGAARDGTHLAKLRQRFAAIVAIDFFGANGRETAEGLLSGLERALAAARTESTDEEREMTTRDLTPTNRLWVTRRGVQVDRIASAWLIRRFIDPAARFKFVPDRGYAPEPGELRYDMFEAEYTHEGDRCTFEVLAERFAAADMAIRAIAEIVHDIDLKDGKYGREEAAGIKTLLAGVAASTDDDARRLERGAAAFDDLYQYFRKRRD